MTERPTKRRRIAVSHTTNAMTIGADIERQNGNPFLDLEALAGEESAEEDEQECEGIVSYSLAILYHARLFHMESTWNMFHHINHVLTDVDSTWIPHGLIPCGMYLIFSSQIQKFNFI